MKRILFFSFLFAVFLSLFCICASAKIYEGRALDEDYILGKGEGEYNEDVFVDENFELAGYYKLMYRLDTETGEMRIFIDPEYAGKPQKMLYYAQAEWIPWIDTDQKQNGISQYIKKVYIEEGIISVGRFSFWKCENLEEVYIPHSVLRIDQTTFFECPKLKKIHYAGTEQDFKDMVEYQDLRNSYTGGPREVKAIDLIEYGCSVRVSYLNQDGEEFRSFTVGGYAPGESYEIKPQEMEGLKYTGKPAPANPWEWFLSLFDSQPADAYTGSFKKDDTSHYYFTYSCEHSYVFKDETWFCSSVCMYCECADPLYESEHTFAVKKDTARGFFQAGELDKTCTVCGLHRQKYEEPIWIHVVPVLCVLLSLVLVAVLITVPVVYVIKKKKKVKALTW